MHFLVRLLLTEKIMFTLYHSNINSFYLHYKQTFYLSVMYFKSHISITNRFVLAATYFKSCSRLLTTLIFSMGSCRTKENGGAVYSTLTLSEAAGSARSPSLPDSVHV